MQYVINTSEQSGLDWGAKGAKRILQNVINLIHTFTYEIAYARTIGISREFVDLPVTQASAVVANSVRELIALREPRARVEDVEYLGVTVYGDIQMRVVVNI